MTKKHLKIKRADLEIISQALRAADDLARTFYPGANPMERRGMFVLMAEFARAEKLCVEALRQERKESE